MRPAAVCGLHTVAADEERQQDRCVNVDKLQVGVETFFLPRGLGGGGDDGDGKLGVVWNELCFLYKIKLRNKTFLFPQKKCIHLAEIHLV